MCDLKQMKSHLEIFRFKFFTPKSFMPYFQTTTYIVYNINIFTFFNMIYLKQVISISEFENQQNIIQRLSNSIPFLFSIFKKSQNIQEAFQALNRNPNHFLSQVFVFQQTKSFSQTHKKAILNFFLEKFENFSPLDAFIVFLLSSFLILR